MLSLNPLMRTRIKNVSQMSDCLFFGSYDVLTMYASDTLSKLRQFAVLFGSGFNEFS